MTLEVKAPLPVTLGNSSALETAYELDVQTFGHATAATVRNALSQAIHNQSERIEAISLGDSARITLDELVNVVIPEHEAQAEFCANLKRSALRQCALDLSTAIIAKEIEAKIERQRTPQTEMLLSNSERLEQLIERVNWRTCTLDQATTCATLIMQQSYCSHQHGLAVLARLTLSVLLARPPLEPSTQMRLSQFLDNFCDSIEYPTPGTPPLTSQEAKTALQKMSRWPAGIVQPAHIATLCAPILREPTPTADAVRYLFLALGNCEGSSISAVLSAEAKKAAMRIAHPFKSDLFTMACITNRWNADHVQSEFGTYLLGSLLEMDIKDFRDPGPIEAIAVKLPLKPPLGYKPSDFFECLSKIINETPGLRFQPAATASLFLMLRCFDPQKVPKCYLSSLNSLAERLAFHIPESLFASLTFGLKDFPTHMLPVQIWQHIFSKFGKETECSSKTHLLRICAGTQHVARHAVPHSVRNYIQNSVAKMIKKGELNEFIVASVVNSVRGSNSADPTRPLFDLISGELPSFYQWTPALVVDTIEPLLGLSNGNVGDAFIEGMSLAVSRTTVPFSLLQTAAIINGLRNFEGAHIDELIDMVASRTTSIDKKVPGRIECLFTVLGLFGRTDTPAIHHLRSEYKRLYDSLHPKRNTPKMVFAECHALTLLNQPWDQALTTEYNDTLKSDFILLRTKGQNGLEGALTYALRSQFPDLDIEKNAMLDGIELDTYIPALRLNVEVDGLHHMGKQRIDNIRDMRLKERFNIDTYRIRVFGKNFNELVAATIDQVNKRLLN
jgi:very-short-patch-repair endonuclease